MHIKCYLNNSAAYHYQFFKRFYLCLVYCITSLLMSIVYRMCFTNCLIFVQHVSVLLAPCRFCVNEIPVCNVLTAWQFTEHDGLTYLLTWLSCYINTLCRSTTSGVGDYHSSVCVCDNESGGDDGDSGRLLTNQPTKHGADWCHG